MALYVQNYHPWREQLAASFLGPLVGGMIEQSRISNANRKENALVGEVSNAMRPQIDTSMPVMQGFDQPSLYGAEASPWAGSARDAGFLQKFEDAVKMPQQTPQHPADILTKLLNSKRFGTINPTRGMELIKPMADDWSAQQRNAELDAFLDAVRDKDPLDRVWEMIYGGARGLVDPKLVGDATDVYKHQNPHKQLQNINAGDRIVSSAFDPRAGTLSEVGNTTVSMSPHDKAQIGLGYAGINAANSRHSQDIALRRELAGQEAKRQYGAPVQGADGNWYTFNQYTGAMTPTGVGAPQKAQAQMDKRTELELRSLYQTRNALMREGYLEPLQEQELQRIEKRIAEINSGPGAIENVPAAFLDAMGIEEPFAPSGSTLDALNSGGRINWGTSGGVPSAANPGGAGGTNALPPNVEAKINQMMADSGQPREAVINYLRGKGMI